MIRPASVPKPALSLVAVGLALLAIAKTTGSGWVVVLLALIAAVGVLALVLPIPALARVRIAIDAPADGTAGRPMSLQITASGTRAPLLVRVRESDSGWIAVAPPVRGALDATPQHRGIIERLTVDLRCAAPLGLAWWTRPRTIVLERPIEVGPAPIETALPQATTSGGLGHENLLTPRRGDDLVRGVRDYEAGDPIKTVHWAATARHARLMVRETESDAAPPLALGLDLGRGGDHAERAASVAAGLALAGLRAGRTVTLLTHESTGWVDKPVRTAVDVSRRLARAVPTRSASRTSDDVVWVRP